MLGGLGNADRDFTYAILGPALDEGQSVENRLDSSDWESRDEFGRMTGETIVKGRAIGVA